MFCIRFRIVPAKSGRNLVCAWKTASLARGSPRWAQVSTPITPDEIDRSVFGRFNSLIGGFNSLFVRFISLFGCAGNLPSGVS
jgi:hypothetical protein